MPRAQVNGFGTACHNAGEVSPFRALLVTLGDVSPKRACEAYSREHRLGLMPWIITCRLEERWKSMMDRPDMNVS